jgi:hypothetical protein
LKTIELIISPAGETQLQTQGFQGSSCQAASRALKQALGLVTHEQKTADFFAAQQQQIDQTTRR